MLGFPGADSCELREAPELPEDEPARPNWRAPQGMRPRHVNELLTAGAHFTADEAYTVRDPMEAGTLHLPSGRLVARDPTYLDREQDAGLALLHGQDERLLRDGEFHRFDVDSGTGCFVDATMAGELGERFRDGRAAGLWKANDHGISIVDDPATATNLIAYPSGRGDGSYPVWIGRDADGEVACFVADMLVLHEATLTRPPRSAGR